MRGFKYLNLFLALALFNGSVFANNTMIGHPGPNTSRLGRVNSPKYRVKSKNPCEIAFVRLLNGKIPAEAKGNPALNMWDERFNAESILDDVLSVNDKAGRLEFIEELTSLVYKEQIYVDNLSKVVNMMLKEGMLDFKDINRLFLNKQFSHASFFYSHSNKQISSKINVDPSKVAFIDDLISRSGLTKNLKKEYKNILLSSNITAQELEFAIKNGMKLHSSYKHMNQFRKYIEFLDPAKKNIVKKGLKDIEKIYDFKFTHKWHSLDPLASPSKKFLVQKSRLKGFEAERLKELEKTLKVQQKYPHLYEELDDLLEKKAKGVAYDQKRIKALQKEIRKARNKVDDVNLSKKLKDRAKRHAKGEKSIYRKMLNGCNSGDSKRLESAKTKFKNFKIGLALVGTPVFYSIKNWDKRKTDPYWMERLGYEMGIGLLFTFVGNKIVTNSNTGFWRKYLEGYAKFSALDGVNALGYDALFGKNSYIRYFQQIYKGGPVEPSEVEKEFEKLKESETFEEDVAALMAYLDDKMQENNTKNFLDKHLNLGAYSSLDDDTRITQEDLESDEAREMMMQLLAERMYLQNMGNWPIFQTGNTGLDRWSFYRVRNVVWDMKGLALNLAMFQIMCREPLGRVGSWGLILALQLGDMMFSNDLTYGMRRDAINQ